MQCPKCKNELGDGATHCGCGWRKLTPRFESRNDAPVPCYDPACGIAAMCKILVDGAWRNLCWQHYDMHFQQQAIDNLDNYGMERQADETRAEHTKRMISFVKRRFKRIGAGASRQEILDAMVGDSDDLSSQP
jgi:hypothetical protein